jgi:hypothetical protein
LNDGVFHVVCKKRHAAAKFLAGSNFAAAQQNICALLVLCCGKGYNYPGSYKKRVGAFR